jgi:release factor glutamine methyltransferase
MNIEEARQKFIGDLRQVESLGELDALFARCMDDLTGVERLVWKLNKSMLVDEVRFNNMIEDLKLQKPIQYILGYEWFGDVKIRVNAHVLIPRPETYELVLWMADELQENQSKCSLIDLGTGSGCIAIALQKKLPLLSITAMDVSDSALDQAKMNAALHACNIEFVCDDMLHPTIGLDVQFDCIVSNPPYILEAEKSTMDNQVKLFEPSMALFVTDGDAMQFYKAILRFALRHLKEGGFIFFEIHQSYATEVMQLCFANNYDAELRHDMYGNARMIKASQKMRSL